MTEAQDIDQFGTWGSKLVPHTTQGRVILGVAIVLSAALMVGAFIWIFALRSKVAGLGLAFAVMLLMTVCVYFSSLIHASSNPTDSHH